MKNIIENTEEILRNNISGFHQYTLTDPIHLNFVSQNFCAMTGYTEGELLDESRDMYESLIHPDDKKKYSDFICKLSNEEQTLTLQYRIVKKDKSIIYVNDTMTSERSKNGILIGYSVLTDITQIKIENANLKFLNDTVPCGFIKYTCEKQPKITYINQQMLDIMRFPEIKDGETDYLELFKENIYLMIPMEERRKFALYLNRIYTENTPASGEITVLRCDGTKAYLFGWITKCVNEQGAEEFQCVCTDITERYQKNRKKEEKRYIKALTDVYDKIFEYDFSGNTVKCLYGQNSAMFKWLEDIPMQMEEATEKWIMSTVCEDDRETVQTFFNDFYKRKLMKSDSRPPQITYRAMSSRGSMQIYTGIFLKISASISLFCCRNVSNSAETDFLRSENASLKNVQELVMRFSDGIAAFEITNKSVTPLYASDNICEFFGFTKEEWIPLMKKSTPIKAFVSRSEVAYEDFMDFLQNGEAEFTYYDLSMKTTRHIKAICSQKSPDGTAPRYVMLYNISDENQIKAANQNQYRIYIRTFGYFDVFVDERPIAFRNEKSKELLALLIDRRGGYVSSEEAIGFLWENETANSVTLSRYRKVALRLKNLLEEYGISDIMESVNGKRRIIPDKVQCDLYDYLSGKEEFSQLFKGSYLTNYSWGERTLAELTGNNILNQEI